MLIQPDCENWGSHISNVHFEVNEVTMMKNIIGFTFVLLVALPPNNSEKEAKGLRIGVKKRIENCPMKSRRGDLLYMHYTGSLEDGSEFDSSLTRNEPFTFTLGFGQVIKGWDQGLMGMCEGEKRKLVVPPELGYGHSGAPPKIPGGATLVFEVELLKISRKEEL